MDMLSRREREQRILFVMSNVTNARPFYNSGVFVPELVFPYESLKGIGYDKSIMFASPEGGRISLDQDTEAQYQNNSVVRNFMREYDVQQMMNDSVPLSSIDPSNTYDLVYVPGSYGALNDLVENELLDEIIKNTYENGGTIAASTFGVAALASVKLSNGKSLLSGRRVACYPDSQMRALNLDKILDGSVESTIRRLAPDAKLDLRPEFRRNIVNDERIITSQSFKSGQDLAREIVNTVRKTQKASVA